VNLHTVRRAYRELAEEGLVQMQPPHPTRVVGAPGRDTARARELEGFLTRMQREAMERFRLSGPELSRYLRETPARSPRGTRAVHVVECSELQARDHAAEIESHWNIRALPWTFEAGEPPEGTVVATYFHYNDIRRRWPHRLHRIDFAAIRPDPDLLPLLEAATPGRSRWITLRLCEYEKTMGANIAADLSVMLPPDRYRIQPVRVERAGDLFEAHLGRTPLLFSPRVWKDLTEEQRSDPRAFRVTYRFEPSALESLGEKHGWARRAETAVST
jgi:hypothetical protein